MIKKLRDARDNEQGFTLVELLVVIIIIGILAAIAIPAFLNQRQRANDAAVESDVKNVATQIETALVDDPNATTISGTSSGNSITVTVGSGDTGAIKLTNGVNVAVNSVANNGANHYVIAGNHTNGKKYRGAAAPTVDQPAADATSAPTIADSLVYDSKFGGLQK